MRVPKGTPLVSIPGGNGGSGNRRFNIGLGRPTMQANANAEMFRGGMDWRPLGQGVADVAKATAMIAEDVVRKEDEARMLEAYTGLGQDLDPFLYGDNGIYNRQGERALGSVKEAKAFFDKEVEKRSKGLSTNAARGFAEKARQLRLATTHSIARHEGTEREKWRMGNQVATVKMEEDTTLLNFGDDRQFADGMNRTMAEASRLADMQGRSGPDKEMVLNTLQSSILSSRIQRLGETGDFDKAFQVWKDGALSAQDRFSAGATLSKAYYARLIEEARTNPQGVKAMLAEKGWNIAGSRTFSPSDFVADFESGTAGSSAVSYDKVGGTSYGKFQLSSKSGTLEAFINWLGQSGNEGAASVLRAAGASNTGSNEGTMPEVWKQLVAEGQITDEVQEAFIRSTHVEPAMQGQSTDFVQATQHDSRLASAVWSTAIQHGASGGRKLLSEAWSASGGDTATFIESLYESRKKQFPSSTPAVREAVAARLDREKAALLVDDPGVMAVRAENPQSIDDMIDVPGKQVVSSVAEKAFSDHQKLEREATANALYSSIRLQVQGMNKEQSFKIFSENVEKVPDQDLQAELFKKYKQDEAYFDGMQKRADRVKADELKAYIKAQNLPPSRIEAEIDALDMSDEGKEKLRAQLDKERNREDSRNREMYGQLLESIDSETLATMDDVRDYAFENALTDKQLARAEAYFNGGGNVGQLRYSTVKSEYRRLTGKNLDKNPDVFEAVKRTLDPGRKPDEQHINKAVANAIWQGESQGRGWFLGFGNDESYGEAVREGRGDLWLPNLTTDDERKIKKVFAARNIEPTSLRMRAYQREQEGILQPLNPELAKMITEGAR